MAHLDNAPAMKVNCGVVNCDYNKSQMCYAQGLEVNTMGDGHAQTREGTCCVTFKSSK